MENRDRIFAALSRRVIRISLLGAVGDFLCTESPSSKPPMASAKSKSVFSVLSRLTVERANQNETVANFSAKWDGRSRAIFACPLVKGVCPCRRRYRGAAPSRVGEKKHEILSFPLSPEPTQSRDGTVHDFCLHREERKSRFSTGRTRPRRDREDFRGCGPVASRWSSTKEAPKDGCSPRERNQFVAREGSCSARWRRSCSRDSAVSVPGGAKDAWIAQLPGQWTQRHGEDAHAQHPDRHRRCRSRPRALVYWATILKRTRADDPGEEINLPEAITWAQIAPALPPADRTARGRGRAVDLAEGPVRELLRDPMKALLPPTEWLQPVPKPASLATPRSIVKN